MFLKPDSFIYTWPEEFTRNYYVLHHRLLFTVTFYSQNLFRCRDMWNYLDVITLLIYFLIVILRIVTIACGCPSLPQSLAGNCQLLLWCQHDALGFALLQHLRAKLSCRSFTTGIGSNTYWPADYSCAIFLHHYSLLVGHNKVLHSRNVLHDLN